MTPDPIKESRKRIRRVAALGVDEPVRFRNRNPNPYAYQVSRIIDYAMEQE